MIDWERLARFGEWDRLPFGQKPKLIRHIRVAITPPMTCNVCSGKGSYLQQEDAHRSEGWVPCYHCIGGKKDHYMRPVYRAKAGRRVT